MNCQDVAWLLDERDIDALLPVERDGVAAHLATCADCTGDWQAFQRLRAQAPARMPADYPARLWRRLAQARQGASHSRRGGRIFLLSGVLLVGTAAAIVAWQSSFEPESVTPTSETPSSAGELAAVPLPAINATVDTAQAPSSDASPSAAAATGGFRLVVLPTVYENLDQAAINTVDAIRAAMLQALRAEANLELVEVSAAEITAADIELPSFASALSELDARLFSAITDRDTDLAIAERFGAEVALRVTSIGLTHEADLGSWIIQVQLSSRRGSGGSIGSSQDLPTNGQGNSIEAHGRRLARDVYAELFPDDARRIWESVAMDVREPEAVRLHALLRLRDEMYSDPANELSATVIASAVDLARSSADPDTRAEIWQLFGGIVQPAFAQPLVDALLYDVDADVRKTAADALYGYLPDPTVEAALESVALGSAPADVRLQARWQLMLLVERADYVDAALRDSSLSIEERMAPLDLFRRRYDDALAADLMPILDAMGRQSDDPAIRATAYRELGRSAETAWLPELIDAARTDPDAAIRRAAMVGLRMHRDGSPDREPMVYNEVLLEALRSDPDPEVRSLAASELRLVEDFPGLTEALEGALQRETDPAARSIMESMLTPPELLRIR
jgi:hypothetical protein